MSETDQKDSTGPESPKIVVGSVVRLKSGGPNMTVDEVGQNENEGDYANCAWFVPTASTLNNVPLWGDLKEAGFSITALELVKEAT